MHAICVLLCYLGLCAELLGVEYTSQSEDNDRVNRTNTVNIRFYSSLNLRVFQNTILILPIKRLYKTMQSECTFTVRKSFKPRTRAQPRALRSLKSFKHVQTCHRVRLVEIHLSFVENLLQTIMSKKCDYFVEQCSNSKRY